jgi:hypothetical protein
MQPVPTQVRTQGSKNFVGFSVLNATVFGILFGVAIPSRALDIEGLIPRNPSPPASHIIEVTHQNGHWIAGADGGFLSYSTDGLVWSTAVMPYTKGIQSVVFWNGKYFAAGVDGATLMTSSDLVSWTLTHPQHFPYNAQQLVPAYGKLFAVGDSPALAVSTDDGVTWSEVTLPIEGRFEGMATNGTRSVIVGVAFDELDSDGDGDSQEGTILSSDDGATWTVRTNSLPGVSGLDDDFLSVNLANGIFVAGGKQGLVFTSPDGAAWTRSITPFQSWIFDAAYFAGNYYLPGRQGKLHLTANFVDWTNVATDVNDDWHGITVVGSEAVVGGRSGFLAHSANAIDWPLVDGGTREYFFEIAHGAEVYVASDANGGIWSSVDSESWTLAHSVADGRNLVGLEWDGARFVGLSANGVLLQSTNGQSWTESPVVTGSFSEFRRANNVWWALGQNGAITRSDDLVTWTPMAVGTETLHDLAYGAGMYVVVGDNGALYSSANGTDWTPRSLAEITKNLNAVAFSGDKFVVLGATYTALTSLDGIGWTSVGGTATYPYPPSNANRLLLFGGTLVALDSYGKVATSTNGLTWASVPVRTSQTLYDLVESDDRTVAVGSSGTIMSSPVVIAVGYPAWVAAKFTTTQRGLPNFVGPGDDPDNDGRPNALEYFSDTAPLVADTDPRLKGLVHSIGATDYPAIQITRKTGLGDATLALRRTTALGTWTPLTAGDFVEVSAAQLDAETEQVLLRTLAPRDSGGIEFLQHGVLIAE